MKTKTKIQHLHQSVTGEMFLNYFLFDEPSIEHLKNLENLPIGKSLNDLVYKVAKYDTEEGQNQEAKKLLHKLFEIKSKKFATILSESDRKNFYDFYIKNDMNPLTFILKDSNEKEKFISKKVLSKEMILFIKKNFASAFMEIDFITLEIPMSKYKKMVKHYSYTV
ncbi:hypothetical protein ACFOWU_09385 [Epilithonimonas zeae]|uniref:Uncharacterized protein n=1 Tax=Epilithonimonas zeae TaxID=1416779 RepID=A0A1N6GNY3_9FLAO|nr:hypothetical protein [Epilithonimonas zeae]SIO09223.1 hypothetical protein SAMN05444409_1960 [Epilithonimonas zeae]